MRIPHVYAQQPSEDTPCGLRTKRAKPPCGERPAQGRVGVAVVSGNWHGVPLGVQRHSLSGSARCCARSDRALGCYKAHGHSAGRSVGARYLAQLPRRIRTSAVHGEASGRNYRCARRTSRGQRSCVDARSVQHGAPARAGPIWCACGTGDGRPRSVIVRLSRRIVLHAQCRVQRAPLPCPALPCPGLAWPGLSRTRSLGACAYL